MKVLTSPIGDSRVLCFLSLFPRLSRVCFFLLSSLLLALLCLCVVSIAFECAGHTFMQFLTALDRIVFLTSLSRLPLFPGSPCSGC